jgi:hypothetical protein
MLCAVLVQPAQAITSSSHFTSAVPVPEKTAYTGVFEADAQTYTGLFAEDDPINMDDPSGNDGEFGAPGTLIDLQLTLALEVPIVQMETVEGAEALDAGLQAVEETEQIGANASEQLELDLENPEWDEIYEGAADRGWSNGTMGRQAEAKLPEFLKEKFPNNPAKDWNLDNTRLGRTGPDVTYQGPPERNPGFKYLELKPYTKSGINRFFEQIQRWALPQDETTLYFYDPKFNIWWSKFLF